MDIYITDIETGDRFRFPMLPQKITAKTGAIFNTYTVLSIGDIKLPAGQELEGFSWQGTLPGEVRKEEPYVFDWQSPSAILAKWSGYRAKKKKLRLLVTETPINHDVYLERYTVDWSGGYGDCTYTINFVRARELKVKVSGVGDSGGAPSAGQGETRPNPPPPKTYTVVKGDSLWKIAQKFYGSGAKYTVIYEANKALIGSDPSKIYAGQKLAIP